METQTTEILLLKIEELQKRLDEASQRIEALNAVKLDTVVLNQDKAEIFSFSDEVTEQIVYRKSIEESETLFKLAISFTSQTVFKQDTLLRYTWIYNNNPIFFKADLLGKTDSDLLSKDVAEKLTTLKQSVLNTGKTFTGEIQFEIDSQPMVFAARIEATKNLDGIIDGIIAVTDDITKRKQIEDKIKESEKQMSFLLKMSDALRPLRNPMEIEGTATKLALDFMEADRCYYNSLEEGNVIVLRDAFREGLTSLAGVYPSSNFPIFQAVVNAGRPFIVDDVHNRDILDEDLKKLCIQLQNIAMVIVPVIKNSKHEGLLVLVQSKPRKWTEAEVQLTIETAERTWVAMERAKVEEALQKSEEKYRTLFNSIDQGFTLCELIRNQEGKGIDMYIMEVNPTYEKQTGITKEMVLGKPLLQVFPSLDKWIETYAAVVDNQCPVEFEHYFEDSDRWFAIKAYPVGKDRFAVLFSDITERIHAAEKLNESEHEMRKIKEQLELSIEAGKIGIWHWDVKKDLLYWSNEQKAIYGLEPSSDLLNVTQYKALVFPEDWERLFKDLQSTPIKEEQEYDFRIKRKNDGETRWVKSRARNILDHQGALESISGVNIDITKEVIALNTIKESEERFRNLAETLPQMVWVMNGDGKMEYGSNNWKKYSGIDDVAEAWNYMMHPDDRERLTNYWNQVFAQGKGYHHEVRLKNFKGIYHWFYSVGEPVLDPDEKVIKWVGSLTDIHEQKNIEEMLEKKVAVRTEELKQKNTELQNMNEELEAFTYISSHDLQEPLRKIQTLAGRIAEKENLSDAGKDYFNLIQNAATRMRSLINDLLTFARLNTSDRIFEFTDLHKIIEEVKTEFKEVMDEKNATILIGDMSVIKVIPFQFRQLIQNLISNSLKFSKPNLPPLIIIKSEIISTGNSPFEGREACHISVSDNGIGFENQFSKKIFEVFQCLHSKDVYQGTGIGLSIVKKIVEIHHGTIVAESEPGKGTTFNIYLPL